MYFHIVSSFIYKFMIQDAFSMQKEYQIDIYLYTFSVEWVRKNTLYHVLVQDSGHDA